MWLPLTMHCSLEAAGILLMSAGAESGTCCDSGGGCAVVDCDMMERGAIVTSAAVKAPTPASLACGGECPFCSQLIEALVEAESAPQTEKLDEPGAWVPVWNFERRVASPPRAPSLNA